MGEQMPPDWAIEKALKLMEYGGTPLSKVLADPNEHYEVVAFARYIAEHEDEPVDPFEAAFDDLYNDGSLRNNADMIRAALKRGMELAGGKSS